MPTYQFQAKNGDVIEQMHPMSRIPASVKVKGRVFKRIISRGGHFFNAEQVAIQAHGYPRVDFTVPKGDLGAGTSKSGHAIIKSPTHEREVIARFNGGPGSSKMHRE